MELGLQGKRALVTGSTAGIGLAIAIELAREGAVVWVNGRTGARVEQAVRQVEAAAGASSRVAGVVADLATAEGAARAISAA
ncbi:MAG TPA: SDR family NAD(P)-dependent oxidoreductase, partial [Anaeromyxobacteraceae bacterium]